MIIGVKGRHDPRRGDHRHREYFGRRRVRRRPRAPRGIPTESQNPARRAELAAYSKAELQPSLARMGMSCQVLPNPSGNGGPFLVAERIENKSSLPS